MLQWTRIDAACPRDAAPQRSPAYDEEPSDPAADGCRTTRRLLDLTIVHALTKAERFSFLAVVLAILAAGLITGPVRAAEGASQQRFALLFANSKYPDADAPSRSAANDARILKDQLTAAGFDVDLKENATAATMRDGFAALTGKINAGSVALIYFTGFGIQALHETYLIPVDAQIWSESDVRRDGVSVDEMLLQLNRHGARVKIAIVDAAYRNPYERRFRKISYGLAPTIDPDGTLAIYSAALGKVIEDRKSDTSLFMTELQKQLQVKGSSAEAVFSETRLAVSTASGGDEVPWVSSSMVEGFNFYGTSSSPIQPHEVPAEASGCDGQNGTVIFNDKFADLRGGWDLHGPIAAIKPPELVFSIGKQYPAYSAQNLKLNAKDGDFCIDFVMPPASTGGRTAVGLVFWAEDYKTFYSMQMFSDRTIGLYRLAPTGWTNIYEVKNSPTVNLAAGGVNSIRVVTKGTQISSFVNGTPIKDVEAEPPAGSLHFGIYTQVGKLLPADVTFRVKEFRLTGGL